MRDLYFKLGIARSASADEVAAALDAEPKMSAYAPILLDRDRRAAYDRAHAALSAIGELRHQLGLNSEITWFLEKYPEFGMRRRAVASIKPVDEAVAESDQEKITESREREVSAPRAAARRSKWMVSALSALVLLIVLILAFTLF